MISKECSVNECLKTKVGKGLCATHYARYKKHGHTQNPSINLTGTRYGRLVVTSNSETRKERRYLECICDCGNVVFKLMQNLRKGVTTHCGCSRKSKFKGLSRTTEYRSWYAMRSRCYDINNMDYNLYGGRGISVCNEWKEDFFAFLAYMGNKPEGKYSIDRINNDGNYVPNNVRWATDIQQANNRRKRGTASGSATQNDQRLQRLEPRRNRLNERS